MRLGNFILGFVTTMVALGSALGVKSEGRTLALEEVNGGGFSQVQVITLNNLERKVHEHMKEYSEKLKEQQTFVDWYLKSYELRKPLGRARSSPIFTFLTMKRLTVEIVNILKRMKKLNTFSEYLEELSESPEWPQEDGVQKVMSQILNIYNTYDFTAEDVASGTVAGANLEVYLDGEQCFDIGKYAVTQKQYGSACEWMSVGIKNLLGVLVTQMLKMSTYMGVIMSAVNNHNKMLSNYSEVSSALSTEEIWKTDLFDKDMRYLTSFKRSKIRHRHIKTNGTKPLLGVSQEVKFHQVCSQKLNQGPAPDVYCWHERSLYPYLILNPLKIELLKRKPFMIQIYNFMPMSTRNEFMEHGIPKLVRLQATPVPSASPNAPESQFHAEFNDYEMNRFEPFLRKIERVVGNYDHSKSPHVLYVSLYALGGFMEPSIDSLLQARQRQSPATAASGQRATIVAYLNYVHAGAFTAFPKLGVATFPTFASAILLYEDMNATAQNSRPCPIISGQNYLLVHSTTGVTNPFTSF